MTPDRAALREIAERLKTESAYPSPSPRWYEDVERIADYVIALTAPLLVKCRECSELSYAEMLARGLPAVPCLDDGASPATILDIARSVYRKTICACHGTGSVERADLAAIRKRFEGAAHARGCDSLAVRPKPCPCFSCGNGMPQRCGYRNCRDSAPCDCWKSTFGLDALLDLIAAQAREIVELKGKANG